MLSCSLIVVSCSVIVICCWWTVSIASWRCCSLSFSCSSRSLRKTSSSQPRVEYLQGTLSNKHSWRCFMRLHHTVHTRHLRFGQGTSIIGHSSRCVDVLSRYSPASWQWGHSYWCCGHSSTVCFFKSLQSSRTTSGFVQPLWHLLGHGRRVKPQLAKCLSSEHNSFPSCTHWMNYHIEFWVKEYLSHLWNYENYDIPHTLYVNPIL